MKKIFCTCMMGITLLLSTAVLAHSDEYLDSLNAPHGGQIRMSGGYHFELVASHDAVKVYVTDHAGTPIEVKSARGDIKILGADGAEKIVVLNPGTGNMLEGLGEFDPNSPANALVTITFDGNEKHQTTFDTSKSKKKEFLTIDKPVHIEKHF